MDKSRLSEDEKGIFDARKANVDLLEGLYIEQQTAACLVMAVSDSDIAGEGSATA